MGSEVRFATREDAAGIADVHIASWRAGYAHVVPESYLYGDDFEKNRRAIWDEWRFHPGQRVALSANDDGLIIGFAAFGPERDRGRGHTGRGELYAFYFHPDSWGDGSATHLIDHVEERLSAEGFAEAVLWVLDDNPRARTFYERQGWTPSGIAGSFDLYCELTLPEVEYRKSLTGGAVA